MTRLLALGVALAIMAFPVFAQHRGAPGGGDSGSRGHGASRLVGTTRASHRNGFRTGVRQRYGGVSIVRDHQPSGRNAVSQFDLRSPPRRPTHLESSRRGDDDDRDDRGSGLGRRYGRGWESGRYRGIPYVNPYGYGYPLFSSGLSYAGDVGYGDAGGDDAGVNDEDTVDGSSGADADPADDDQGSDSPAERETQDDEPTGAQRTANYPAFSGSSAIGGTAYMQPPDSSLADAISGQGIHRSGQGAHLRANRKVDSQQRNSSAVTLVFKDGRPPQTIHNYALTRSTLYVMDAQQQEIPVADLDMQATEKVNREAGIKFQLPQ